MDLTSLLALIISTILVLAAGIFMAFELYVTIIGHLKGAPFVKSGKKNIATMLELAQIKKGDAVVDLGSGDGTLCIESAQRGASAFGVEINPFLVRISQWKATRAGVGNKVKILKKNFWDYPLTDINVVFLYLWPETLERLEKKLRQELKPGSRIISNNFPIKGWTAAEEKNHVYLYRV